MFALFHYHCTAVQYHVLRNELCVACLHCFTVSPSSITYYETNIVLHVCSVSLSLYRRPVSHTTKLTCMSALFHYHCIAHFLYRVYVVSVRLAVRCSAVITMMYPSRLQNSKSADPAYMDISLYILLIQYSGTC